MAQDAVLEIGPGQGALTRLLARSAGHLTLIEYDPPSPPRSPPNLPQHPTSRSVTPTSSPSTSRHLRRERGRPLAVVGNLPYYITSEILLHLVAHHAAIDRAVLMVQREVAERVAASPGTSDYGVLSATMQLYGNVELLFTLPPSAFAPPPEVYSSVFRFHVRPRFDELGITPEHIQRQFIPFIRTSFAQKRKTWANNLRNAGYHAGTIAAALAEAGLNANVRAEAVDLPGMAAVFRALGRS